MCTEVELAMSVDHDDAATDTRGATKGTETYVPEEVPGVDGEGGKQVEGVAEEEPREDSDAIMEGIVTEKGKEMASVGYGVGEEKVAEQAEMASVDLGRASSDNVVRFEMFLEQQTFEAMQSGKVIWWDPNDESDYRCEGLDPETFPGGEVPMKAWSGDKRIALLGFALAHRRGRVTLPPAYLLMACMPALSFLWHIIRGDIVIHSEMNTYGFRKPLNNRHYPDLECELIKLPDDDAQQALIQAKTYLIRSNTR